MGTESLLKVTTTRERPRGRVVEGEEIAGAEELIERLDGAVRLGHPQAIATRVQTVLERVLSSGALYLPDRFRQPKPDAYARRLLHRDPELDYTAVVMTWGPGQQTPLHDHDGCWCVEGVVEGEIQVTRYELLDGPVQATEDLFHFRRHETLRSATGEAGALIPPLEHHVLGNAWEDGVAVTLHVYQGEMARCAIFEPVAVDGAEGLYRRRFRSLGYDG
jgi:predicted metal-dependent enzyme (double-stranded beta helix superfamily)